MDIQVGDRVTYIDKKGHKCILIVLEDKGELSDGKDSFIGEILKIERPKYEIIEEKKELLTEEEKEFLKQYIKINNARVDFIKLDCNFDLRIETTNYVNYIKTNKFQGLEINRNYNLKELGLEEN